MKLDNKNIHDTCALVEEEDFEEAIKIGNEMLDYVRKEKFLSLAANQVGHDKQIMVALDNDGYDIYFNPEIQPKEIHDGMISIAPESTVYPASLPSFPKKRVLVEVYNEIEVSAFSVANDERITFEAEGNMAKLWQVTNAVLSGIHIDSIVPCDYTTIRSNGKKKPNAKCPDCGKKNKKCKCVKPEPDDEMINFTSSMV